MQKFKFNWVLSNLFANSLFVDARKGVSLNVREKKKCFYFLCKMSKPRLSGEEEAGHVRCGGIFETTITTSLQTFPVCGTIKNMICISDGLSRNVRFCLS